MKNIYLLPTKPDYPNNNLLFFNNKFIKCAAGGEYRRLLAAGAVSKHIYIISNEQITEGDWYASFILDANTKWKTIKLDCIVKADLNKTNEYLIEPFSKYCKKIILTTDQNLIQDGVQEINDEFLEWFCSKNGKVDFVEVISIEDEKN